MVEQRLALTCPLGVDAITEFGKARRVLIRAAASPGRAQLDVPLKGLRRSKFERRVLRELQKEIPVLMDLEGLVEAAAGEREIAGEQCRRQMNVVALVELDQAERVTEELAVSIGENGVGIGMDHATSGCGTHERQQSGHMPRLERIV